MTAAIYLDMYSSCTATGDAVESADAMGDRWDRIPEDLFIEIHRRLPPCPGRRLRLVCRHWRKAIDDGTPKPQARAKVLAFVDGLGHPRAYVFDDLTTRSRDLNLRSGGAAYAGASMAGTCNGLLCLRRRHGDVVVANPATGEKLAVPPPPSTAAPPEVVACNDAAAYGFGYHPATGLYKVVHLPCDGDGDGGAFDAVNVFTLGDGSWRRVPVPAGSSCRLSFGIVVTVDGAAYWVSKDDDDEPSLMAFDLKDERLASVTTVPKRVLRPRREPEPEPDSEPDSSARHLVTDGRGRLGLAVCAEDPKRSRTPKGDKTEVWMLEDGGSNDTKPTWVLRYAVSSPEHEAPQEIAWPLVADGGQHILSTRAWAGMGKMSWVSLHAYSLRSEAREHGGVALLEWEKKKPFIGQYGTSSSLLTFAYVETREPLALYGHGGDVITGDGEWSWVFNGLEGRWKLTRRLSSAWNAFR